MYRVEFEGQYIKGRGVEKFTPPGRYATIGDALVFIKQVGSLFVPCNAYIIKESDDKVVRLYDLTTWTQDSMKEGKEDVKEI